MSPKTFSDLKAVITSESARRGYLDDKGFKSVLLTIDVTRSDDAEQLYEFAVNSGWLSGNHPNKRQKQV